MRLKEQREGMEGVPQFSFVFGSAIPNRLHYPIPSPILRLVEDKATFQRPANAAETAHVVGISREGKAQGVAQL